MESIQVALAKNISEISIAPGNLNLLGAKCRALQLGHKVMVVFIGDPELCDSLERADGLQQSQIAPELLSTILTRSARAKAQVVSQDERELTRLRATLNYGHPIGHAIENVTKYTIDRGEAVFILPCKIGSTCKGRGWGVESDSRFGVGCAN